MPIDPNLAGAFRGFSLPQIDHARQVNALGQLDLQATQQKVQGMMNPNATPEDLARSGNVDVAHAVTQQQQIRRQNASQYMSARLSTVRGVEDLKRLTSDPNFGAASEAVGMPHSGQVDNFAGLTDEQAASQSMNLARILSGAAPNADEQFGAPYPGPAPGSLLQRGPHGEVRQVVQPTAREPLHAVIGDDGKPVLMPESQARGRQPYTPSAFASNAPVRPADDPEVASWAKQVLAGNALTSSVPMNLRSSVMQALSNAPAEQYSPTASARMTLAAHRITQPYTNMSAYKLTADGKPYLERIDAALKNPGSVADQDLLDSLTKLNTGGNAVTEAQVSLITHGQSFSDMANTFANKFKNGGVLSPDQRQQIHDIAYQIYDNYKKGYQPIYDKAAQQLTQAGIPQQFWTIPDLNSLNSDAPPSAGGHPADIQAILDSLKK